MESSRARSSWVFFGIRMRNAFLNGGCINPEKPIFPHLISQKLAIQPMFRFWYLPKYSKMEMYNFFQKKSVRKNLLILKIDKIQHFCQLQTLCLTDFHVLLSKCFFLSIFQILKFLGGVVWLD